MWQQTRSFNRSKAGTKAYWCLRNVRMGYQIDPLYADAWEAWQKTQRHTGTPPAGVDVPVFFEFRATLDGVYKNWGHIAVRLKDGRVWTDGRYYSSISSLVNNYLSNGKYVGWGESVNNVRVIKNTTPKGEIMDTDAKVQSMYNLLRGRKATSAEVRGWKGKTYREFAESANTKTEVSNRTKNIKNLESKVASLQKQVKDLKSSIQRVKAERDAIAKDLSKSASQLDELVKQVNNKKQEISKLQDEKYELGRAIEVQKKEIKRLQKEVDASAGDMTGLEYIVEGVKKLLRIT